MIMNEDTWYVVRNIRGVTGFVGPGSKPVPLTAEEMKPYGLVDEADTSKARLVVDFKVGDTVMVTSGAWEGVVKPVLSMNMKRQTVTINVGVFGRETPTEISFSEVKKV
jgi:transcriptional antiterminator NusG